jgi:hypothetical protein
MTEADRRVAELLERWLVSVELHARYLPLDDAAYAQMQDWPPHQRPTRWVIDLARARLGDLRKILAARQGSGDEEFAEALELMAFLTTLLGSEHVERFVPLASPAAPKPGSAPRADAAEPRPATPEPAVEQTAPHPIVKPSPPRAASPARRTARAQPAARPRTSEPAQAPASAAVPAAAVSDRTTTTVIADAVRFLQWGREWPQVASLIARLADRPAEAEIWRILRLHRAEIEKQARRARP